MDRIPAIKRGILREPSPFAQAVWAVLLVAVPIGLRWVIDRGQAGVEFVTIFPAVVVAALLLGWRWGAAVALVAGFLANRLFRPEPVLFYADARDALMVSMYALTCAMLIWIAAVVRRLVREQQLAAEREALLNHELMHRVKNMLATVNALAVLTARSSGPAEFAEAFRGRMRALERATGLLSSGGRIGRFGIRELVADAIAPFRAGDNFAVSGPDGELPSESCLPLALALHELCTNASKYGALSAPGGRVALAWAVGEGEGGGVELTWREEGGPPVEPPRRRGMGTQLLRAQTGLDAVELEYPREGVRCTLRIATGPGEAGADPAAPEPQGLREGQGLPARTAGGNRS